MLEARVHVGVQSEGDDHGVVVAVDVRVDAKQSLDQLSDGALEVLGEVHADPAREDGFVVDVGLHPRHQVLDVLRGGHLGRPFVLAAVLPEVFEPENGEWGCGKGGRRWGLPYSSVAFISGQVVGEQNSVIEPYFRVR